MVPIVAILPEPLWEILESLIDDLATCGLDLQLGIGAQDWVVLSSVDGSGVGIISTSDPLRGRTRTVAESAQDFILEQRALAGLPAEWPPCPRHPNRHPMWATNDGGRLGWRCPTDPDVFTPLGHLQA